MTTAFDALLAHLVDYAGLFPPASLAMQDAVRAYATYRDSPRAQMLGRFVVPAARLGEFAERAKPLMTPGDAWPLSVLATPADAAALDAFDSAMRGRAAVECVEGRVNTPAEVAAYAGRRPAFVEIPLDADPAPFLDELRRYGLAAKARTGGVTNELFPTAAQLARFIAACASRDVPFKATAGLHHPLRGEYLLTYAQESPHGTMFGFLNVFVAAVLARGGMAEREIVAVLEERAASAFTFDDDGLACRAHRAGLDAVRAAREKFATSFGSCSFAEPVDDLTALGLL
ncbi:MAG: hypothetical protein HY084_14060 [Gemmatimonadetes bacterium]|nr:hypothetical protein [Gemmatimonadota bacterium]